MAGLLFAGDTHGSLDHLNQVPAGTDVLHVGDFAPLLGPLEKSVPKELHKRFWWIPGNHDFDHVDHMNNIDTPWARQRSIHMRVGVIAGMRIAGLGGIFSASVWYPRSGEEPAVLTRADALKSTPKTDRIQGGLSLKHRKSIFAEDVARLTNQRADVLVTHEAPSCHRYGFAALDSLARAMGVHTIVHGHHHEDYVAELPGGIRVVGVGLRGLAELNGVVFLPGMRSRRR